jgi:hypothetical protein
MAFALKMSAAAESSFHCVGEPAAAENGRSLREQLRGQHVAAGGVVSHHTDDLPQLRDGARGKPAGLLQLVGDLLEQLGRGARTPPGASW